MKIESQSAQLQSASESTGERGFNLPFEKIFPNPVSNQQIVVADAPKASFKPTSVDIDEFLKNEWIFSGLTRENLQSISLKAKAEGSTRKQQLSEFLGTHFDDVTRLSDQGSGRISSSDLKLYGQLLRVNELSANPSKANLAAWKPLHHDHEMNQSLIPVMGGVTGVYAFSVAMDMVGKIPVVATKIASSKASNPRGIFVAAAVAAYAGSYFGGRTIGDVVNRAVNSSDVKRHFYDEAAPAMKRLMEG